MAEVVLTIVGCERGDWYGIYVNGKLFTEGHDLTQSDFCELISKYQHFDSEIGKLDIVDKQMDELGGTFPYTFEELLNVIESKGGI